MKKVLDLKPKKRETMSIDRFLKVSQNQTEEIERTEVIPPVLGQKGFGRIVVFWKRPTYSIKRTA